MMIKLEDLAEAALARDALRLNSLVQDLWRSRVPLSSLSKPLQTEQSGLVIIAALLELLAQQWQQAPPAWTEEIGAMPRPFFFSKVRGKNAPPAPAVRTALPAAFEEKGLIRAAGFFNFCITDQP